MNILHYAHKLGSIPVSVCMLRCLDREDHADDFISDKVVKSVLFIVLAYLKFACDSSYRSISNDVK